MLLAGTAFLARRRDRPAMRAALLLAAALLTPGCAFLAGEGEEALVVHNADRQPLSIILVITQVVGGIRLFGEEIALDAGQTREYVLVMKPGQHVFDVTTSTSVQERLLVELPERGDTTITLDVHRGGATVSLTTTR